MARQPFRLTKTVTSIDELFVMRDRLTKIG